jgi:hypothetical protein
VRGLVESRQMIKRSAGPGATTRARRAAAVAALIVLLGVPTSLGAPAPSLPASAAGRITLGHRNVITGDRTRAVSVTLPRPASIAISDPAPQDLSIRGPGRFVGFALFEDDPGTPKKGIFVGRPATRTRIQPVVVASELQLSNGRYLLPAGDYVLYLLADGRDVSVTVTLEGLSGTRAVTPTDPVQYSVAMPAPDYDSSTAPGGFKNLYSAGATRRIGEVAFIFDAMWERHDAHVVTEFMSCHYDHKPQGPAPFAPGCPGAAPGGSRDVADSPRITPDAARNGALFYEGAVVAGGRGPFALGGSITSAASVTEVGFLGVWLTLER